MNQPAKLFGSVPRTEVLVAVALLNESYPAELAQALDLAPISVQRILGDYEREGVLVSRLRGRSRMYSINRHLHGASALSEFLLKYALETDVSSKLEKLRMRPRRPGKEL